MDSLKHLLSNYSLADSTRVVATENGSLGTGDRTSSLRLGRLFQGLSRYFSQSIQDRNRRGIDAYLNELGKVSPLLQHAAASELEERRAAGSPLTIRKIREVGGSVLAERVLRDTENVLREIRSSETSPGEEQLPADLESSAEKALTQLRLVQAHLRGGCHPDRLRQVNSRIEILKSYLRQNTRTEENPGAVSESLAAFSDVPARIPPYVRASEFARYNPFFINTSDASALEDFGCLRPIEGVNWLWAVNERNEVILGAEVKDVAAGKRLMEAYQIDHSNLSDEEIRGFTMMGHPSVIGPGSAGREEGFAEARLDGVLRRKTGSRSKYTLAGESLRKEYAKGKYGGEIVCDAASGEWYLNSNSGRFGSGVRDANGQPLDEAARLSEVSSHLGRLLGHPIGFKPRTGAISMPSSGGIVADASLAAPPPAPSQPLKLDELTGGGVREGVTFDSPENLLGRFDDTELSPKQPGVSVTEERVGLDETPASAREWPSPLPAGTTIPRRILVEASPGDLAQLDGKYAGGYLDRSRGVDTERALFLINGENVPGNLLRERVTALALSHGISDEKSIQRLYSALDSQFPHAAGTEFEHHMNPDGVFNTATDVSNVNDVRDVRSLEAVDGAPGVFVLKATLDRRSGRLSVGRNEPEVYSLREFEAPSGSTFRYQGRIAATITFPPESGSYPTLRHSYCRSLLTLERQTAESTIPSVNPDSTFAETVPVTPTGVVAVDAVTPAPETAPGEGSRIRTVKPSIGRRVFSRFLSISNRGELPKNPQVARPGIRRDYNDCFLNSSLQMVAGLGITAGAERPMLSRFLSNGLTTYDESRQLHAETALLLNDSIRPTIVNGVCMVQNDANSALRGILEGLDGPVVEVTGGNPGMVFPPQETHHSHRMLYLTFGGEGESVPSLAHIVEHWSDGDLVFGRISTDADQESPAQELPIHRRVNPPYPEKLVAEIPRAHALGKVPTRIENIVSPVAFKGTDGSTQQYEPAGYIVHYGASLNSGHYVYFEKAADGTWTLYDDAMVTSGIVLDPDVPEFDADHCAKIGSNMVTVAFRKLGGPLATAAGEPTVLNGSLSEDDNGVPYTIV